MKKKKKLVLDLEIKHLTKSIIKGQSTPAMWGRRGPGFGCPGGSA